MGRIKDAAFFDRYLAMSARKQAFQNKRMYSVEIELTRRCQLQCAYCYNWSGPPRKPEARIGLAPHPPFVRDLLQKLAVVGVRMVMFQGGEPLLYEARDDDGKVIRLADILRFSRELGLQNYIFTNGVSLTPSTCESIRDLVDGVSYHLDSTDADVFAGLQDSLAPEAAKSLHAKATEGIDNLIRSGFDPGNVELNIVVANPGNDNTQVARPIEDYLRLMNWGVNEKHFGMIVLLPLHPVGKASRGNIRKWLPSLAEMEKVCKYRAKVLHRNMLRFGTMDLCKHYCMTNFYIDIEGDVSPCSFTPLVCGNVYRSDVRRILEDRYEDLSFAHCVDENGANRLSGPCGACHFADTCFGCRANAHHLGDGPFASDPLCWLGSATRRNS